MNISSAAAPAAAPTYAQAMQAREMARQAKANEKRVVAQNVADAMSTARFDALEHAKRDAKAKLVEIAKRIQLLKKLFGGNPKEMARALAQIFKELRAAVKAYKDAGGEELGQAGQAAKGAVASDAAPKAEADDPEVQAADGETPPPADTESSEAKQDVEAPEDRTQPTAVQGSAVYDAVVGKMRKSIGEDGLDFVKTVRSLVNAIKDVLEGARTQARAKKPDKDTDKAFEAADKEARELSKDLDDMAREIHNAVPDADMKLSVDA